MFTFLTSSVRLGPGLNLSGPPAYEANALLSNHPEGEQNVQIVEYAFTLL